MYVPLYNPRSNNIYLIHTNNMYNRILYDDYRIVDKQFYDTWKKTNNIIPELEKVSWSKIADIYYKTFYESFNRIETVCSRAYYGTARF